MRKVLAPLRLGMIVPRVRKNLQLTIRRRCKPETDPGLDFFGCRSQRLCVPGEVGFRPAVSPGLPVKAPVFNVHAHGQPDVGVGGQLLAGGPRGAWPVELKDGGVAPRNHAGPHPNLNRAAVARVGNKTPDRRRPGLNADKTVEIKWRNEAVRVDPDADALGENMPVHRQARMQIGSQHTVVLGTHAAQIHADPRHAADAVRQKDQLRGARRQGRGGAGRGGGEKANGRRHMP